MFVIDKQNNLEIQIEIIQLESSQIGKINANQFEFDWKLEVKNNLVALQIVNTREMLGLMSFEVLHEELRLEIKMIELSKGNIGKSKAYDRIAGILISYACKISFQLGFFGFVSLVPKTRLIDHYKIKYGFEQYGRQLAIDFERSEYLIDKYLLNK